MSFNNGAVMRRVVRELQVCLFFFFLSVSLLL